MVCSCAYYENVSENLEQSQRNKFDHIYRPLCDTKKTRIFHFQRNGMVWALLVQNGLTVFFYPKLNDSIHCDYLQDTTILCWHLLMRAWK